jgi:hypothetical protein
MSTSTAAGFLTANPHALATILEASETKSIIASRDIFDVGGVKLWARDQPVSQALQRKLLDRQLRHPLESCLLVENGVTGRSLAQALEALLASSSPLAPMLAPHADDLAHATAHLPLHPVAQLLLTVAQASRPERFGHAVQAMALNGALTLAHGGGTRELRIAMLCGLLHDLGEMYIAPRHGEADADRTLDLASYQQLVVHPHVGRLLIEQLTNYPPEVARAIAEHHERLDGSGYPHCLQRDEMSPLGRQLAVTEAALATLGGERAHLTHASVSLRVVPGEFDLHWVGAITHAARRQPPLAASIELPEVERRLTLLDGVLQAAQAQATRLMETAESLALKDALALGLHLLSRLRMGWNASGLWSGHAIAPQDCAEVEAIEDELAFRLRAIERAVLLRARHLPESDSLRLALFAESLVPVAA